MTVGGKEKHFDAHLLLNVFLNAYKDQPSLSSEKAVNEPSPVLIFKVACVLPSLGQQYSDTAEERNVSPCLSKALLNMEGATFTGTYHCWFSSKRVIVSVGSE